MRYFPIAFEVAGLEVGDELPGEEWMGMGRKGKEGEEK